MFLFPTALCIRGENGQMGGPTKRHPVYSVSLIILSLQEAGRSGTHTIFMKIQLICTVRRSLSDLREPMQSGDH